jgi:hypothetical protein
MGLFSQVVDFFECEQGQGQLHHACRVEIPAAVHIPPEGCEMRSLFFISVYLGINNLNLKQFRLGEWCGQVFVTSDYFQERILLQVKPGIPNQAAPRLSRQIGSCVLNLLAIYYFQRRRDVSPGLILLRISTGSPSFYRI